MLGPPVLAASAHLALALVVAAPASAGATVETEVTVPAGSEVEIEAPVAASPDADAPAEAEVEAPADADAPSTVSNLPTVAPPLAKRKLPQPEYGPFYEAEAPADSRHHSDAPLSKPPPLSVARGAFCFVEDARCGVSLLASADVGVGINIPAGDRGVDVPMSQFGFRGGLTFRPITLARHRWNRWAVGFVAAYARSSGALASTFSQSSGEVADFREVIGTNATRFALVNQLWLSQKRHALHLDFTLGVVRSTVLTSEERYFGTHVDVALGVGGWGALFLAGDFLDKDARIAFGFRGHGVVAGPVAAMVLLGLLAGGAL